MQTGSEGRERQLPRAPSMAEWAAVDKRVTVGDGEVATSFAGEHSSESTVNSSAGDAGFSRGCCEHAVKVVLGRPHPRHVVISSNFGSTRGREGEFRRAVSIDGQSMVKSLLKSLLKSPASCCCTRHDSAWRAGVDFSTFRLQMLDEECARMGGPLLWRGSVGLEEVRRERWQWTADHSMQERTREPGTPVRRAGPRTRFEPRASSLELGLARVDCFTSAHATNRCHTSRATQQQQGKQHANRGEGVEMAHRIDRALEQSSDASSTGQEYQSTSKLPGSVGILKIPPFGSGFGHDWLCGQTPPMAFVTLAAEVSAHSVLGAHSDLRENQSTAAAETSVEVPGQPCKS
ncbi:hypothetical protein BJ546DRAFT_946164 [Cryomyces antarcticus]